MPLLPVPEAEIPLAFLPGKVLIDVAVTRDTRRNNANDTYRLALTIEHDAVTANG